MDSMTGFGTKHFVLTKYDTVLNLRIISTLTLKHFIPLMGKGEYFESLFFVLSDSIEKISMIPESICIFTSMGKCHQIISDWIKRYNWKYVF